MRRRAAGIGVDMSLTDDLERATVGGLVRYPELLDTETIAASQWSNRRRGAVVSAMRAMRAASQPVDLVTVSEVIAGDPARYLSVFDLSECYQAAPVQAAMAHYLQRVRRYSDLRSIRAACSAAVDRCTGATTADPDTLIGELRTAIEAIEAGVHGVDDPQHLASAVSDLLDDIERREKDPHQTTPATNFTALDHVMGGLVPGRLILLAARPGMGKTALAMQWALGATDTAPVLFAALEMSREEMAARVLASDGEIAARRIRDATMTEQDWVRAEQLKIDLADRVHQLWIDDRAEVTVDQLAARARLLAARHGAKVLVVDYLQLIQTDSRQNRTEAVGAISRKLKILAKQSGLCVVALSQLNRGVEQRQDKAPILSDLRESGSLEQDADQVLMLWRPGYYDDNIMDDHGIVCVRKNRHGTLADIRLRWVGRRTSFSDDIPPAL